MKDIVEAEPVRHNVQHRARTSAYRITKGLQRHQPVERWIKEINKSDDVFFQTLCHRKEQRYLQNAKNRQHVLLLQPINGKMELISQIRIATSKALQKEYQYALPAGDILVNETKPEFEGDYTVVLFSLIKQLKKKPDDLG